LAPPKALLALGAAVGGVTVVAGVVLALAVVGVVVAAAAAAAVVGVVLGAAVVVVVLGAVVVVEEELFDEGDEECDFLAGEALGVPEPQAAAIRPPASTMVPTSHRVRLRLGSASVAPRVLRANPNTYCSSHLCGAPSAKLGGAKLLRRVIPNGAT
jgi:hypothetical protein